MLLNLGLNAIAAIQAAYPRPAAGGRLVLAAQRAPGGLHSVVRDNGQGMPDDVRVHIFDPSSLPATTAPAWAWPSSNASSPTTAARSGRQQPRQGATVYHLAAYDESRTWR